MSLRLRSGNLAGYARQRGAIGLMAALTLGIALVFLLLVIDSSRLYVEKRKLQSIADIAALEAVQRKGDCLPATNTAPTYAGASAVRNGYVIPPGSALVVTCGVLATGATNQRVFSADSTKTDAIQVIASRPVMTSVAGGIWAMASGSAYNVNTQLSAVAVAAPKILPPQAQLTIKSTLVTVDSSKSAALNLLFGQLLGGSLNLSVAGWQGLVDTNINLLSYLNQLALNVGVTAGAYDQLLTQNVKISQLLDAAITVLSAGGSTASVAVSGLTSIKAIVGNLDVTLGSLLQLQTGAVSAGLNTTLNVFQLAEAFVQLANTKNGVVATIPVSIPGLLNGGVQLKVIQPPQLSAIGDPTYAKDGTSATRIYVKTAQLSLGLTLGLPVLDNPLVEGALNGLVGPLSDVLNNLLSLNLGGTINSVLCLLGGYCQMTNLQVLSSSSNPPAARIDVVVQLARAESYVTGFTCASDASKTLTTQTNASIVTVQIGQSPQLINAFNSNTTLNPIPPLPVVDIGAITCFKPLLGLGPTTCDPATRKAFYGGGIGLSVNSSVGAATSALPAHTYLQPPEISLPPQYYASSTASLLSAISNALSGIQLQVYKPTGFNLLGGLLTTTATLLNGLNSTLGTVIGGVLSPILDPLVNSLLSSLGVNLNAVEVGANLSCRPHGQAALVN
ncbi:pilus assembly protein TadG-related protein [Pseudomonas sp. Bout1]|uniref:pilus assembly protein TadG-related protein n=1 Tax=Pseudomonas sp. Bout1 TaxID=3048600 RepID=UPI002AB550E6|nr:pilus assembly protein TadG-related protein [Pseudomonas sp. Bout1]MDY7530686.1 pilus assembly protein TadG-related protein [Pseudomonas sp. Bout1]MEB0188678.1 pilus assembly protein TadG-related protein [Pseudomonas sp. Bout1]